MNTIIEQALQLSKEEKIELFFALHDNLGMNYFSDDEEVLLTEEQWNELQRRQKEIEDGTAKFISEEEFLKILNESRKKL